VGCPSNSTSSGRRACGSGGLPLAVCADPKDPKIAVVTEETRIQKLNLESGEIALVAGANNAGFKNGAPLTARFKSLSGPLFCGDGSSLLFCDADNNRVALLSSVTVQVSTVGHGFLPTHLAFDTTTAIPQSAVFAMGYDVIYRLQLQPVGGCPLSLVNRLLTDCYLRCPLRR
jgi:hypothetical protein